MTKRQKAKLAILTLILCGLYWGLRVHNTARHVWGYSIYGIDVSKWQGTINWEQVKQDDITFTFIKASQGVARVDSFFQYNWAEAGKQQIYRGAYHYYEPDRPPKEQARNFIRQVKLASGDMPPVLDLEEPITIPLGDFQHNVQIWLDEIEKHYQVRPIIYASPSYYRHYLMEPFHNYPVWIAQYKKFPRPKLPKEGEQWLFWQFTNKGSVKGINGDVDLDVFWGNRKQLEKQLK